MTMTEIKNYLTLNLIQVAVVNYYEISLNKLITSRLKKVSEAMNIAIYLCRQFTSLPAETIGQAFGGKDHTSVICALYRIEDNLKNNCFSTIESLEKLTVRIRDEMGKNFEVLPNNREKIKNSANT